MSSKLKWATAFALALLILVGACVPTVSPNGDTLNFVVGDSKIISNGTSEVTLTYGESGWECADGRPGDLCIQNVAGQIMLFFGTDKIGVVDVNEGGKVTLYGEWHEKE